MNPSIWFRSLLSYSSLKNITPISQTSSKIWFSDWADKNSTYGMILLCWTISLPLLVYTFFWLSVCIKRYLECCSLTVDHGYFQVIEFVGFLLFYIFGYCFLFSSLNFLCSLSFYDEHVLFLSFSMALLRYHLYTLKFTHFKRVLEHILGYWQNWTTITAI